MGSMSKRRNDRDEVGDESDNDRQPIDPRKRPQSTRSRNPDARFSNQNRGYVSDEDDDRVPPSRPRNSDSRMNKPKRPPSPDPEPPKKVEVEDDDEVSDDDDDDDDANGNFLTKARSKIVSFIVLVNYC